MGRIRTMQIKNLADTLLNQHHNKFTDDFERNKKVLDELIFINSKKIRNRLSGYITHVIIGQTRPKTYETPYVPVINKRNINKRNIRRR